ncbi:MAG: FHA domain-containing protein [Ktedonobacteraceae bacterium]|nr:FHA domain-containing protein [Ktedonobacteraceae bacterium]
MVTLTEGQKFERYRVLHFLGKGVSGESYEAEDTKYQRKVTLKLIHPWLPLADSALRQFFREMQHISIFTHPCLATIFDYGDHNGQLYAVRHYTTAGSLLGEKGRLWYQPPLPVADAIALTHQLAQALNQLHSYDYAHGSLTLSNILVVRSFTHNEQTDAAPLLIADAGLAHFVRRFGRPVIRYLPITAAPEQLGHRTVPASDQYALAILLYFWLTGHLPFTGTPEEVEQLKLSETFPSLREHAPQVTGEQEAIIQRALSVYPEERYPSTLAFTSALCASLTSPSHPQQVPLSASATRKDTPATPVPSPEMPAILHTPASLVPPAASVPTTPVPDLTKLTTFPSVASPQPPTSKPGESDQPASPSLPTTDHTEPAPPAPQTDYLAELLAILSRPTPAPQPPESSESPVSQPGIEPDTSQPHPQPHLTPKPQTPETPAEPAKPSSQPVILSRTEPDSRTSPPAPEQTPPSSQSQKSDEHTNSDHAEAQQLCAFLVINSSRYLNAPREIKIERETTTIGRAGTSDVLLDQDPLTSRHQALLKREGSTFLLYDQGSAYGTLLNGEKLTAGSAYSLHDGDHITIGAYELTFHLNRRQPSAF